MSGGSMSFDGLVITIDLVQDESARIVDLLNHVESNHAGFLPSISGVSLRFRHELIQRVRLNLKMHHDSNHQSPLSGSVLVATKSRNESTTETQRTRRQKYNPQISQITTEDSLVTRVEDMIRTAVSFRFCRP